MFQCLRGQYHQHLISLKSHVKCHQKRDDIMSGTLRYNKGLGDQTQ